MLINTDRRGEGMRDDGGVVADHFPRSKGGWTCSAKGSEGSEGHCEGYSFC